VQRKQQVTLDSGVCRMASIVRLISYPPGMKIGTSPFTLRADLKMLRREFPNRRRVRSQTTRQIFNGHGNVRPCELRTTQGFRYFSSAPASSVADITIRADPAASCT
jgi:hypothetical protein